MVAAHRAVRRQHEPAAVARPAELAGRAVEPADRHPGREPLDLGLPVAEQAGRADHERRAADMPCSSRWRWSAIRVTVLPSPMSSARQAPSPSAGELGEPGEAVALVVAQLGAQAGRRLERLAGRRGQQLLAHLEQAGADDRPGGRAGAVLRAASDARRRR